MLVMPWTVVVFTAVLGAEPAAATDPEVAQRVARVIAAVGGKDQLLTLFRIKEHLVLGEKPDGKGLQRVSVLEPPQYWWIGKGERGAEPAKMLAWIWTMGALVDPKAKITALSDITDRDQPAFGLRLAGTINPPMDVYFAKSDNRLLRVDWRSDIHRFSEWKTHDGVSYASLTIGYKKSTGKPWYYSRIIELERLEELPAGLSR